MPARVEGIHVAARKGAPMEALSVAECRADFGFVGDRYAKSGSPGQVTLVSAEDLLAAEAQLGGAIAAGATRRNITISGQPLPGPGGRLRLGEILVEITGSADPCGLMERCVAPGALAALQGRAGMRARVLRGGVLRVGDAVGMHSGPIEAFGSPAASVNSSRPAAPPSAGPAAPPQAGPAAPPQAGPAAPPQHGGGA